MNNKSCVLIVAAAVLILAAAQCVWAVDSNGQWLRTVTSTGDWSVADNWLYGTIATGDNCSAIFYGDIATGDLITVNVDPERATASIGHLTFIDYTPDTAGSWLIKGDTVLNLLNTSTSTDSQITVSPVYTDSSETAQLTTAEISAPVSVASGTNLSILGGGTLKLSGNTNVVGGNATIQSSTAVNLSGNMTLNNGNANVQSSSNLNVVGGLALSNGNLTIDGASTLNVTGTVSTSATDTTLGKTNIYGGSTVNLSGSAKLTSDNLLYNGGTFNVGLTSTDAATVTLKRGLEGGWNTDVATINVRGTSTITTTGTSFNEVQLGPWGSGTSTINMYDDSVLNTALLTVAKYDTTKGYVNLNGNARINATNVVLNHYTNPSLNPDSSIVTLNFNSRLYASDMIVGLGGNGLLVVNGTAEVHVSGTLHNAAGGFWGVSPSVGNQGEVRVNGHGKVYAGAVTLDANWTTPRCLSLWRLTDDGLVSVTGNFAAGTTAANTPGDATVTIDKNARLSVGGQLTVGSTNGGTTYLSLTASPGETSSLSAGSMIVGIAGDGVTSTFDLSGDATATVTNALTIGQDGSGSATVNVSNNARLQAGSIAIATGGWNIPRQLNISNFAKVTTTGDFSIGTTGWTVSSPVTVSNDSSLTIGGNLYVGEGSVYLNDNAKMSVAGNFVLGANDRYSTMDVTHGTPTDTALTVGGNVSLVATNGTLSVRSISSGPASNGALIMTGASSTLYFNGARISSPVNTTTFIQGIPHAVIQAGGAKFNLNDYDGNPSTYRSVTVAQNLEHDSALGSTPDGGLSLLSGGMLTLTGTLTYTGPTVIDGTGVLNIYTPGTTSLAAIAGSGTELGNLVIGDGSVANTVRANSVNIGTLTLGIGSRLVINPIPGGPSAGGTLTTVPEPSTFVLLTIAALGLIGAAWRKRK